MPVEIGQLADLQQLDLRYNQLTALPPEIGQLGRLERLYLRSNQLKVLPAEIGELAGLQQFYLRSNQLTTLPAEIGRLRNLQQLDLSGNQLSKLPVEIGGLTKLQNLILGAKDSWENDPRSNNLSELPQEIASLTKLTELKLKYNQFNIPPEVHEMEPAEKINYILNQQKMTVKRVLNEAKVLLVGQGGVGKTSLVRRLVDGDFDPLENKTEGIDIRKWHIQVGGEKIRLNVWDFGGQEIMHATHQFFLTKRSLYLLIWDARQEDHYGLLEYWLQLIQSFGGDSPIIIVLTQNRCWKSGGRPAGPFKKIRQYQGVCEHIMQNKSRFE